MEHKENEQNEKLEKTEQYEQLEQMEEVQTSVIEDPLWNAVCNNDLDYVKNYYAQGGESNKRFNSHSLTIVALRNHNVDMVRLLEKNGETILDKEAQEYTKLLEPLYEVHYKDIVEEVLKGHPLHINFEYERDNDISSLCTVTSSEYPDFNFTGKYVTLYVGYYALCDWLKKNKM